MCKFLNESQPPTNKPVDIDFLWLKNIITPSSLLALPLLLSLLLLLLLKYMFFIVVVESKTHPQ